MKIYSYLFYIIQIQRDFNLIRQIELMCRIHILQ